MTRRVVSAYIRFALSAALSILILAYQRECVSGGSSANRLYTPTIGELIHAQSVISVATDNRSKSVRRAGSTAAVASPPDKDQDQNAQDPFTASRHLFHNLTEPLPTNSQVFAENQDFIGTLFRWNGDVLWAPASKSVTIVTKLGDEARAVFGQIPDADCSNGAAKVIPLEVDGDIVDLVPNPTKSGHPLEFAHRTPSGDIVRWTEGIPKCDKPSLAGDVTYCGLNSRLEKVTTGNVEWLTLCRKSTASRELASHPYWQRSNPKFSRLGTIGFNWVSGEIVFFDGRKDQAEFDWSKPFPPPGGRSYSDEVGRIVAEKTYDSEFQIECYSCHDNKGPYVIDPNAENASVGFHGGERDSRAIAFSLRDFLRRISRPKDAPFRVIGSGYTERYAAEIKEAKTVRDPTGACTECHVLTTQTTGRRFAADAVGLEPFVETPNWRQTVDLYSERLNFAAVAAHRTDWALTTGNGKIHPWMRPIFGNDLSAGLGEMSVADWRTLSNCLWNAGGAECGYAPLYTACPVPESPPPGDPAKPTEIATRVLPTRAGEIGADRVLRVSWKYLNDYGAVPERDDVRFNVAVRETAIPPDGQAPSLADYPNIAEVAGKSFERIVGEIGMVGSAILIQNASYDGHYKWTDPAPSTVLRDYKIDFPGRCNRRYLIRILPKRFCFDQSGIAYSSVDHLVYADIGCN